MNYPPSYHQEANFDNIIDLMKNYPFATLVSIRDNQPYITHIPLVYENDGTEFGKLVAHIDKYNPHVASLTDGANVTVVFKGPDCYISPSVYSTRQLPTWNYVFAHVQGTVTILTDKTAVKDTMVRMTAFLEGDHAKYKLNHDDPRMERLVDYIVGFEITIAHWEGKFKFSQDKLKKDQELAKQALIKSQQKDVSLFIDRIFRNHKNAQKKSS